LNFSTFNPFPMYDPAHLPKKILEI